MSPSPRTSPRTRYHHGDLRNALTGEAVDLARAGGPDAVVLREVARRVGVSPTAAYRYFATHEDLLDQVKQEALARLREFLIEAVSAVPADGDPGDVAVERLRASGNAYVAFARAEPGLFDTAFCRTHSDEGGPGASAGPLGEEEVLYAETEAYRMLGVLLDDLVAVGRMDPARRPGAEVPAWAAVHGFACLAVDGPLGRHMPEDEQRFVQERMIDMVVAGLTQAAVRQSSGGEAERGVSSGTDIAAAGVAGAAVVDGADGTAVVAVAAPDGEPATRSGTGSELAPGPASEA